MVHLDNPCEALTQDTLKEILSYDPLTGIFKWNKSGRGRRLNLVAGTKTNHDYISITVLGVRYYSHRLAHMYMTGVMPDIVDHDDQNGLNNIWTNLNNGTSSDNAKNTSMRPSNKSGTNGVHWCEKDKAWVATITSNGKRMHLGQSKDINIAIAKRKEADIKYGFHKNHGR